MSLLSRPDPHAQLEVPEVASPTDVALYRGLRASVPVLLEAYDEVARLFR